MFYWTSFCLVSGANYLVGAKLIGNDSILIINLTFLVLLQIVQTSQTQLL